MEVGKNVYAAANYILAKKGSMTAMKLQKLLYYSQAWSLIWDEKPLFSQKIEAWASGPVVPEVYQNHQGKFKLPKNFFADEKKIKLNKNQKETIDAVLKTYGNKNSYYLSELTHKEAPWKEARQGLKPGERGSREITHASMCEYYSSL